MPVYKLTYFNLRAKGETIRLLFSYGNIPFEDVRIDREKEWPNIKSTMPFGQVPILEIDGKIFHQSLAICRYLAKTVGLAGENNLEELEINVVVDTINDFRLKSVNWFYETDLKLREEKRKNFNDEVVPYYLQRLETIAKANNGHLALGKITWADLFFMAAVDNMNIRNGEGNMIENYPFLNQVVKNTLAIDNIKRWVEKRPESTKG